MSLSKFAHSQVMFNSLPLLEATSLKWTKSAGHKRILTPKGQGIMPSLTPVQVTGSIDVAIPRGGHEFDYNEALKEGQQITVRRKDLDRIEDAVCVVTGIDISDNFLEDRACSVSFEGSVIE